MLGVPEDDDVVVYGVRKSKLRLRASSREDEVLWTPGNPRPVTADKEQRVI